MPNINVEASHTMLTAAMSAYVNKKISSISKFLREENDIHVQLDVISKHRTGPKYTAHVTILPRPGIHAEYTGEDIYEAIDLSIQKIRDQLIKNKDRIISDRRRKTSIRKME